MQNLKRAAAITLAVAAIVLGMLVALTTAAINSMPDDEPLDTMAAAFKPLHAPSVAEPPPDTRRIIDPPIVVHKPVAPVVAPVALPEPPKPVKTTTTKPKKKPQQPVKSAPAPAVPVRTSSVTETAIAFAMAQLGKPYRWGATGPGAYDCSGLVMRAFQSAGVQLPRSTKTIIGKGKSVSRQGMIRGDLIWTSSGHIGIYLGNNKMIHAPQTGDVVKISTVWSFYAARRL